MHNPATEYVDRLQDAQQDASTVADIANRRQEQINQQAQQIDAN